MLAHCRMSILFSYKTDLTSGSVPYRLECLLCITMHADIAALARIRHVALDMDGTIYKGSRLFACTLPFLACLRKLGIGYTFLTNNTSRGKSDYVEKLRRLGIQADERQIF